MGANIDWFTRHLAMLTIGPDKANQLRHARLFRDPEGDGRARGQSSTEEAMRSVAVM